MFCRNCGKESEGEFCPDCHGVDPERGTKYCLHCGREIDARAKVCPKCACVTAGTEMVEKPLPRNSEKHMIFGLINLRIAILLCVIPGIGHVYAGYTKAGIVILIFAALAALIGLRFLMIPYIMIIVLAIFDVNRRVRESNRLWHEYVGYRFGLTVFTSLRHPRSMKGTRAERLISNADGMDAVVIANGGEPFLDSTFWYLSESNNGVFEGSFAIVSPGGELHVIVSQLEEEAARGGKGSVHVYTTRQERDDAIKEALKGCTKVGFNVQSVPYAYVKYVEKTVEGIEVVDATKAIESTVSVKDEKEIEATRKACAISSKVAAEIPDMLSEGCTEKQVAARMDARMRELGGTGNAFDTIAAFGAYSSEPHHMPCDYALKKGDTALFDFGTKYDRYCSDMTRTVFLGRPPEILERAYEVVKEAQLAGIAEYRDGAEAKAADLAARKIIDESEFKGRFIHSFGHGIGMDVHQAISVSPRSDQVLKAGNIVSAEPGIYLPGIGGCRIEDTVAITETGYRNLVTAPKELIHL